MPITVVVLLAHGSSPLKADLSSARAQIWGQFSSSVQGVPEERDVFGKVLAAGDFNGDGRKDLAIGTPGESVNGTINAGAVSVLYGATSTALLTLVWSMCSTAPCLD